MANDRKRTRKTSLALSMGLTAAALAVYMGGAVTARAECEFWDTSCNSGSGIGGDGGGDGDGGGIGVTCPGSADGESFSQGACVRHEACRDVVPSATAQCTSQGTWTCNGC